jgi:beta-phosphoglucomutase-like phosphatase (HAD superfamily)
MLTALLFDVDGTLADTERDGHRVAFNHAFAEMGFDWRWDEALYDELLAVAGGKERLAHYLQRFHPQLDAAALVPRLHALKTEAFNQLLRDGRIPLRPGVKRLLLEARAQGVTLAIATTTTPENVTTLLRQGLGPDALDWFAVIGAGDVVPRKKPAPDIYHWVLERLAVDPAHCLAVEDSALGLQAARAAGLDTIVTVNASTRGQNFTHALAVLTSLGEPEEPATRLDRPWQGVVTLAQLGAWKAEARTSSPGSVS